MAKVTIKTADETQGVTTETGAPLAAASVDTIAAKDRFAANDPHFEIPAGAARVHVSPQGGFGSYGETAAGMTDLTPALDKPPASKTSGSLDFTNADKLWLKNLGLTTTDPNSFHKAWQSREEKDAAKHRKWADTMHGRIGMRLISRGIVGAAFFVAGERYSAKALKNYNYDFAEGANNPKAENVIQFLSKIVDRTAGEGIKAAAKLVTGDEKKAIGAVMFRDTLNGGKGISLGKQFWSVTGGFTSMSFGDYMTRYVLGLVDPNSHSKWHDKNGKLDIPAGTKELLYNMFRGVTYASGEDIAVALPYVYGMRLTRHLINKESPGFKFDADLSRNGGSFKVAETLNKVTNTIERHVTHDFQTEGMLDLMLRFTGYNVMTKMFRDAYSIVQGKVEDWQYRQKHRNDPDFVPPEHKKSEPTSLMHKAATVVNYLLRTTIKVTGYMIPATAFFFVTRSAQSKVRGLAIAEDGEAFLGRMKKDKINPLKEEFHATTPYTLASDQKANLNTEQGHFWSNGLNAGKTGPENAGQAGKSPFTQDPRDTFTDKFYQKSGKVPWYNKVTTAIADFCYSGGEKVENFIRGTITNSNKASERLFKRKIIPVDIYNGKTADAIQEWSRMFFNASMAYTPYFMMKSDVLSAEWDTDRMDMAIDRTLSGMGHLKWGEFRAGLAEITRATMREPFTDPKREALAQEKRWGSDPEHRSNEAYQLSGFRHRYHVDMAREKEHAFANEALRAKGITPDTLTQLKPRESWVAQEAARKFQDASPQEHSIH